MSKSLMWILPLLAIFVLMYFFSVKPQKKRQQEAQDMRNNLKIGETVITVGGIIGTVTEVKEDSFILKTGPDDFEYETAKWSIRSVENPYVQMASQEAQEAARKAVEEAVKHADAKTTEEEISKAVKEAVEDAGHEAEMAEQAESEPVITDEADAIGADISESSEEADLEMEEIKSVSEGTEESESETEADASYAKEDADSEEKE